MAPSLPRSLPLPRGVRRLIAELVIADREKRGSDFVHVDRWPERISGFEDLAFLFSSTILGHGIASLRLDEAAYLYRLVRELKPDTAVEIGRYRGGSTFLIASALGTGTLHSYDIASRQGRSGAELDRELLAALDRFGLADRVRLYVADSRSAEPPGTPIDLLFIDGDHSEEGVRADLERWGPLLSHHGHVLMHDAAAAPDFVRPDSPGPARVAGELGDGYRRHAAAGSLAHFQRI
ncbi:MAG: class I SAM-dependent methyltransferase [Gaiellaceae bacterium]